MDLSSLICLLFLLISKIFKTILFHPYCSSVYKHICMSIDIYVFFKSFCTSKLIVNQWITNKYINQLSFALFIHFRTCHPLRNCLSLPSPVQLVVMSMIIISLYNRYCQRCGYTRKRLSRPLYPPVSIDLSALDARLQQLDNFDKDTSYTKQKYLQRELETFLMSQNSRFVHR